MGLRIDGVNNTLIWKLRRIDKHGVKNFKVGKAIVSLICKQRNSNTDIPEIEVESNEPFTLILIHPKGKKKIFLEKGKHLLDNISF